MKTLLLYPEIPDTFWSFRHALKFIGKKAYAPPLGLLTVGALLPEDWEAKLLDLNVESLSQADLRWADCAFISAMTVQRESARRLIQQCREAGLTVVAGGPLFSSEPEAFGEVDHLVLDEAELTLPEFLRDFARGTARHIYRADGFPSLHSTPAPAWHLLNMKRYATMPIQYSRGCPNACEFCNVTVLFGKKPRTKTADQIIAELEELRRSGWRGRVFFVDDNFIAHRRHLKEELLPRLIEWRSRRKGYNFFTEAGINLADDPQMMRMLTEAGFTSVFVGIETPDAGGLAEVHKNQNTGRDLSADVRRIQRAGLEVQGGFIVGFDSDPPSIFKQMADFIEQSGIAVAMVGLLQAPVGTKLYQRLEQAGRVLGPISGNNVDGSTNIIPAMGLERLRKGYRSLLDTLYSPARFYDRAIRYLREFPGKKTDFIIKPEEIGALLKTVFVIGIRSRERLHYWKLMLWTLFRRPSLLPEAVTMAIYGHHFRMVCERLPI
jgi:radical SAM superfamily enzyme YgiQ (UPF0313 family)